MHRSTSTESLSHGAKTLGDRESSKAAWNAPGASDYNVGTELILLSVRGFDEFSNSARASCNQKFEMPDWSACGLFDQYRMMRFQRYLQNGKRISGRHSNTVTKQQMCHNGHNAVSKAYGNLGGNWEMGQ
jgi:hypothetical protein